MKWTNHASASDDHNMQGRECAGRSTSASLSSPVMLLRWLFFRYSLLILSTLSIIVVDSASPGGGLNLLKPSDADALLAFKSKADLYDKIRFSQSTSFHFCQWQGVQCQQHTVVHLVIEGLDLGGVFASNTLTRLDQLRVLSLQNNSLTGPIPNLSALVNLKSLFLDHNSFTGTFPPPILSLHRLRTLDLSYNNLTGPLPALLTSLDRIYYLRLEWNRFNGTVPPLNQSSLETFNVSGNNLSGVVPVTPTLLRFGVSSFSMNPGLCGKIINIECNPSPPFFGPSVSATAPPPELLPHGQTAELRGVDLSRRSPLKRRTTAVIIGFSTGVIVLIGSLLCFVLAIKKQRNQNQEKESSTAMVAYDAAATAEAAVVIQTEQENELEEKVKRVQGLHLERSGSIMFCAGEAQLYTLDHLMSASAEMLGRGSIGTTYKAVLDNRLIVSVKRLDANKLAGTSKETFQGHMESVGGLRHPNLVPLRAYFQAREERLLIFDYQPNGSLSSLIHGSKSTRAKPLHWTSCLKIAEDIAQGLSYIHQAWRLVHGNLKSSNVLLGPDFEACVVDYCLAALAVSDNDVPEAASSYKAPETRNPKHQANAKSDVYSYGVLLLELLTGKSPSQHPHLVPDEMVSWVRSAREDDGGDDDRLVMLIELAMACSLTSPEQRPTMWQVLKMLQEIKEAVVVEDAEVDPHSGLS